MAKRATSKQKAAKPAAESAGGAAAPARTGRASGRSGRGMQSYTAGVAKGKDLVIVESPSKAKTINKYLGSKYHVMASIGHVRDLPSRNEKGDKRPVPGVDLEHDFKPTYVISEGKEKVIADLKRAAKDVLSSGGNVWFATDLDREGEAIAWHLAQVLGISSTDAKRVMFAAITKDEIARAFSHPHPIDEDRVNAQQARRVLDRIVGYQVSPLLWKKVARGLSAGRVQSVAVRLVVEREREIRAFVPDEYWELSANFTEQVAKAAGLAAEWSGFMSTRDEKNNPPTGKAQGLWLGEHGGFRAQLIEVGGEKVTIGRREARVEKADDGDDDEDQPRVGVFGAPVEHGPVEDLTPGVMTFARLAGLKNVRSSVKEDPDGRGPARFIRTIEGEVDVKVPYKVASIETKRTTSRPAPPFITSTLQQAASTRLGFAAQRTMRTAQQLYEGVEIPGEGPVGLITYMRTDSTNLSREALEMARDYIGRTYGDRYLPEKPNFYSSSNKDAQEAHEAIRPTNLAYPPSRIRGALSPDQFRLYSLIWDRFVACQMTPAQWDATTVTIVGGADASRPCTFRAGGRILVFDGFYRVAGVPASAEEQTLPRLAEKTPLAPFAILADQKFTSPPPRYTEASLIKVLESEGIGRPSTYASIISVIQERKYVELAERRFFATDLGEVVTDKLLDAFPEIMDVRYTRDMEKELDKVEEDHIDWVDMLRRFYGPFKKSLAKAETSLVHAKAETLPAPFTCPDCGSPTVYKFGKSGRFLSCSTYPACKYASPVDREGKPRPAAETVDVACPKCGSAMNKRIGRFGPFLGCSRYGDKTNPCDASSTSTRRARSPPPRRPRSRRTSRATSAKPRSTCVAVCAARGSVARASPSAAAVGLGTRSKRPSGRCSRRPWKSGRRSTRCPSSAPWRASR